VKPCKEKEKTDKAVVMQAPIFNKEGTLAIVNIRSQDNKDRWIVCINLETQQIQEYGYLI
jgi:hypothetical protein